MLFEPKAHQEKAHNELLKELDSAIVMKKMSGKPYAISFQAPTGAGKTYNMAHLFDDLLLRKVNRIKDFVILWVSYDPELNVQSRAKMHTMSPITQGNITIVDNTFNLPELQKNHMYMINTQKLSSSAKLTKGDKNGSTEYNFWDVWEDAKKNTEVTPILIIDEAHQGQGNPSSKGTQSIVKRIINGENGDSPAPIVIGVSATPSKFIGNISDTHTVSKVTVPMNEVMKSGLIKEFIYTHYTGESVMKSNAYISILTKEAASEYNKFSDAWRDYCEESGIDDVVKPLILVQVPDKVSVNYLSGIITELKKTMHGIGENSFVHNISDFSGDIDADGTTVRKIAPSDVQEDFHASVYFIKESGTTGWDCPRAEVFLSFRPHKDADYITQAIGRIIRTPLARSIDGNDVLNTCSVILPFYDSDTIDEIDKKLRDEFDCVSNDSNEGPRIILKNVLLSVTNDDYRDVIENLPSYSRPRESTKSPIARLRMVERMLNEDGIGIGERKSVTESMIDVFTGASITHKDKVDDMRKEIAMISVNVKVMFGNETEVVERPVDGETIMKYANDCYKRIDQDVMSNSIARYFASHDIDEDERNDVLLDFCAAGLTDEVVNSVNDAANDLIRTWVREKYARNIKDACTVERQNDYYNIMVSDNLPTLCNPILPDDINGYKEKMKSGVKVDVDVIDGYKHIYSDEEGNYYAGDLGEWEKNIIMKEMELPSACAFYRNPARGASSLSIPYVHNGENKMFSPDFLVIKEIHGELKASIVDPHGAHLEDSLSRAHGIAKFVQEHADSFHEIIIISTVDKRDGDYVILDVKDKGVIDHILNSSTIKEVFQHSSARIERF